MSPRALFVLALAIAKCAVVACGAAAVPPPPPEPADMVVTNAQVFTSNARQPRASAFAVRDGKFVAVGNNRVVKRHIGPQTQVIDARRRSVTPGFVDNHCHAVWIGGMKAIMADLYDVASLEQLTQRVQAFAAAHPDVPVVGAVGWKHDYIPGYWPTKELADTICSDRPLFMMAFDGGSGWVNTRMAEIMLNNPEALAALTPHIDSASGEFTGLLYHFYAFNFLDFFGAEELGPAFWQLFEKGMADSIAHAISVGVTTIDDVQIYNSFLPIVASFKERGGLDNIRVRLSRYVSHYAGNDTATLEQNMHAWIAFGQEHNGSQFVAGDSVKLYIDGLPSNYTAYLKEPYSDKPDFCGYPLWTQEDLNNAVALFDRMGIQVCTHSVGDAAISMMITAYEHALAANGAHDARHRLDHCELPVAEDIDRMVRAGIIAPMQPTHYFVVDNQIVSALGRARCERFMPWRTLARSGIDVSFGSDWCAGPINPLYGIIVAMWRVNSTGVCYGPWEAVRFNDAIRYSTIGSARALKMEDRIGSIEPGKFADFVVWKADLRKIVTNRANRNPIPIDMLDQLAEMTVLGGRIVYQP